MRRQRILLTVCMIALLLVVQPAAAAPLSEGAREASPSRFSAGLPAIQDVFVILMENHNWNEIKGSPSTPYMNNTLLPIAAHAEAYSNLPGIHPSLPNYLWLEAGTNFGVADDNPPAINHQSTTQHLTTLLQNAGITWKAYEEDIPGTDCPLTDTGLYAPRHDPMVYFDDVTNTNSPSSANCIAHIRPYSELANDLTNGTPARYNFITPNVCDDMHNSAGCATNDQILNGDTWLSQQVPQILNSAAYKNNGALFITWDESEGGDYPIGMIALSPLAKQGYASTVAYSNSSTLRTLEEFFGVTPLLGGAANANDLSDLFNLVTPLPPRKPAHPPNLSPVSPLPPVRPVPGLPVVDIPNPLPPPR
jgi:phosphatidylinositol-3-phosphatase